jgi:hypothetical protein
MNRDTFAWLMVISFVLVTYGVIIIILILRHS